MACCGNQAILKTSKLGTQFFAHKSKPETNDCSNGGETPEHIHIKYLVSKKLFECGKHPTIPSFPHLKNAR
jgi:competence protein CoiA